jgi:DNA-binding CsgD family transcriptional regulator
MYCVAESSRAIVIQNAKTARIRLRSMLWTDDTFDPQDLRTYIRDLIALSALPAIWKDYQPQQIAESVAGALLAVLSADLVYVSLPGASDHQSVEVIRVGSQMTPTLVSAAETVLRRGETGRVEQEASIADPAGKGQLRVILVPLGLAGMLAAGSLRPDFPSKKDRLLTASAAGDVTVALSHRQSQPGQAAQIDRGAEIADAVARIEELSPRGRQILEALASGRANKVIAHDLGISERTVEVHRSRMMKQLSVRHLFEAIRIAVLAGLARTK